MVYYHTDHLNTPKLFTNQNQDIVWQAEHTPFGELRIAQEHVTNNIRFPGQYFDVETGMSYNYFRTYDASLGRYIQSDPIGLGGGINTYGYVLQNPLVYIDPFGLSSLTVCANPANAASCAAGMGVNAGRASSVVNGAGVAAMMASGEKAKRTPEERALNKEKNRACKSPDPKTNDPCADAKSRLNRLQLCLDLRTQYRDQFGDPGFTHSVEIINTIAAVKKAEEAVKEACKDENCP